jgi:glutaredoxin
MKGMLSSLLAWWRRRSCSVPPRPVRVVLYTRKGCHLCEDAYAFLRHEQRRFGYQLEVVDVDAVSDLVVRYGEKVPVVAVDGKVRFWGVINPVLLTRLLRAGSRV